MWGGLVVGVGGVGGHGIWGSVTGVTPTKVRSQKLQTKKDFIKIRNNKVN